MSSCDKISNLLKNVFYSEPVYDNKFIKTEIKIYSKKINTILCGNKIPNKNEYCTCLSVILLDSIAVNANKTYYPQIFLEEYKYAIKKGNKCNQWRIKIKWIWWWIWWIISRT